MIDIPPQRYFDAIDATWAPARFATSGPFRLRYGAGGGKRVSAATLTAPTASANDIKAASIEMIAMGQSPLFMLKPGQEDLDNTLETEGFKIVDPVVLYASPVETLAERAPEGIAVIPGEMPLAAQREIWEADGIGAERIEVMKRSTRPQSYLLGRFNDKIAGTVFASCDNEIAMLHALTVNGWARRNGVGQNLTYGCARWAMKHQAKVLALMTTQENIPARTLYERIGMTEISRYHYRIKFE